MKVAAVIVSLALLAGCAADPTGATGQQLASSGREEKVVCAMEEPTGSKLRVKRCFTKEQLEQEGQDARKVIERGQLVRPAPTSSR